MYKKSLEKFYYSQLLYTLIRVQWSPVGSLKIICFLSAWSLLFLGLIKISGFYNKPINIQISSEHSKSIEFINIFEYYGSNGNYDNNLPKEVIEPFSSNASK